MLFLYALIPSLCMLIGAIVTTIFEPKPAFRSAEQHFAAGVVFAAVALELLPHLTHTNHPLLIAGGFGIGVFSMMAIKIFTNIMKGSAGLLAAVGVDVTIDGLLIGIAFEAGKSGGLLITTALAIEIFFLGLATTATLKKRGWQPRAFFLAIIGLAVLIPLGCLIGTTAMHYLPKNTLFGVIAFGTAALLYLVTEELLKEAHEVPDRSFVTASFFLGFLIILLMEQ